MNNDDWRQISNYVTDAMREHTRPFVTPLSRNEGGYWKLEGSGSYVDRGGQRVILTCEHVGRYPDLHCAYWQEARQHRIAEEFELRKNADLAWAVIADDVWAGNNHNAQTVPYSRFAERHSVVDKAELLFLRGFAGENSSYDLVDFKNGGTGYCSQESQNGVPTDIYFEVFWRPNLTSITTGTDSESRANMRFTDPAGLSGSLVWNTRYVQAMRDNVSWNPSMAAVTGIVRRYDPDTHVVLVQRVEHIRAEMDKHLKG